MPPEVEPLIHPCPHCGALIDVSDEEPFSEVRCPQCEGTVRVRTRFNHFELIEPIASGGMGTVYKARDENLNRIVALKLLRKEFSLDEDYIEKLETEAKITASVNHPHVVNVFSFGSDGGQYYIAMELVDKGSLDDLMTLQNRIAEVQVLEIGIQVAEGLKAAYEAGLIHRDVKPGNILFADAHTAKMVDFGLAMPLEQAQEAEEEIWGTPYYVAPEKLNHEPEDFRSDIYSLGGTLFHALAGRPPFEADNASLVALKHIKSQVVSLQAFAPDISSATSYVINRTLAKDPEDRYQSYDELIEHLTFARAKLLESTSKPREPKARVVLEGAEQQTMLGYIIMGVIGLLILLGVLLFVFRDEIAMRRMTPAERERVRLLQAAGSVDDRFLNARNLVAEGEAASALPVFWNLERRRQTNENLRFWITLHEGLSAQLSGMPGVTAAAYTRLGRLDSGTGGPSDAAQRAFAQVLVPIITSRNAAPARLASEWREEGGIYALGLFILGLHEWELGQYQRAEPFFKAFVESKLEGEWSWVARYQPLAQQYLHDYELSKALSVAIPSAQTPEAKKKLLKEIGKIRSNLKLHGRLTRWVGEQEAILNAATGAAPKTPPANMATLQAQAAKDLREFKPDAAIKALEEATIPPGQEARYAELLAQAKAVEAFKKRLIKDINADGFYGEAIRLRDGRTIPGRFSKAKEEGLESGDEKGKTLIPWSQLRPESIAAIGASFIKSRSGEIPSRHDVPRLWELGAYQSIIGMQEDGLARMMRAAEVNREYTQSLPLFDPTVLMR